MKNNNTPHAIELINELFKKNGKKDIPDVKLICSKAKVSRNTAVKYLYEWWEKNYNEKKNLHDFYDVLNSDELPKAIAQLQCLAKELEAYSDSLNYLPDHTYPLGNFILKSLQEIESNLVSNFSYLSELKEDKKRVEEQLDSVLEEKRRLDEEVRELQRHDTRKIEQLQEQLDAKKRENLAAYYRIKSLKREKRRPTLKSLLFNYNLARR